MLANGKLLLCTLLQSEVIYSTTTKCKSKGNPKTINVTTLHRTGGLTGGLKQGIHKKQSLMNKNTNKHAHLQDNQSTKKCKE